MCILALVGCGDNKTNANNATDNSTVVEDTTTTTEKEGMESTEQQEDSTENNEINVGSEPVLSDEDIESAKKVAMDYYAGTVFEVNSMAYVEPGTDDNAEGECNFMVNVSKDGEVQEPDNCFCRDSFQRIILLHCFYGLCSKAIQKRLNPGNDTYC